MRKAYHHREPQECARTCISGQETTMSPFKLYTDISLLTCDRVLNDATSFFNAVTGFTQASSLEKLAMAPLTLSRCWNSFGLKQI